MTKSTRKRTLQLPEERSKLDGLYGASYALAVGIPGRSGGAVFIGQRVCPRIVGWLMVVILQQKRRLHELDDAFSVFRCLGVMDCVNVCPRV